MHTIDPALLTALLAMCVGVLMVDAGLTKRRLAWRPRRTKLHRKRRR